MASQKTAKTKKEEANLMLVYVVPIARGVGKEYLTYYTAKNVQPGSIVSVPIRSRTKHALVVHTEPAGDLKAQVKSSAYALKKVHSVNAQQFFLPSFIRAAQTAADYFAHTTGSVLSALTPAAIHTFPETIFRKQGSIAQEHPKDTETKTEQYLIQASDAERISTYKSIIREEFAQKNSVFFCLPEISEIEQVAETLERGIEEYTYIFHSSMTKKAITEQWKKILKVDHPVLIIATGQFLSLPRTDIHTIIVEKESSRAYKQTSRPFVDMRTFAELLAQETQARLIMGDIFLRPETLYRARHGAFAEFAPLVFRPLSSAQQQVIDMRPYTEAIKNKRVKKLDIVSKELHAVIEEQRNQSEHLFILTARRGLHPITICNDCGTVHMCEHCSAPTVLHKPKTTGKIDKNAAVCHKCGTRQTASDVCGNCGGWRLTTLGAGIEYVEEEITRLYPDTTIFRLDRDTATTHKKAKEIRDAFYNTPGSIMLGTEMAVSYLNQDVAHVAVVSIDSLFTIPDFRINERVFTLLIRLREKATKQFLIQTRDIENRIFSYATKGNMIDFYREEIAERKILKYPPFVTLIKIALEGPRQSVETQATRIADTLTAYETESYPAFTTTVKGKYRHNVLIKIPHGEWIDPFVLRTLRELPQSASISVDPEDVL